MKILFWCEIFLPHVGGIEILVSQLVQALVRQGHACEIITSRYDRALPARDHHHGAVVHRIDLAEAVNSGSPRSMLQLCQQVREIRQKFAPDVHHMFLSGPLVMILQMTNRAPVVPIITTIQAPPASVLTGNNAILRLLRESASIIVPNRVLVESISAHLPEVSPKVRLLPNCTTTTTLLPSPLPLDPPVLLFLGRLVQEKGTDVALHALALLAERWSAVRLIITGDGEERAKLEVLSVELGLSDRVEFTGAILNEDVPARVNQATLLLVPSRWQEPFGIVCLDAAIMGRPVVASHVGGIPEVVRDGETGLLVENENPQAMAHAIETLLEDPARLQAMGQRARSHAEKAFSFESYASKQITWYTDAAASAVAN